MRGWLLVATVSAALTNCAYHPAEAEVASERTVRFAEVASTSSRPFRYEAITLFYAFNPPGLIWARRVSGLGGVPEWASSETCPAVLDAASEFAKISSPQLVLPRVSEELPGEETSVVVSDHGPTVTVWARGLFSNGQYLSPGEIEIRGGSELPHSQWLDRTVERLSECWRSQGPE